MAQEHEPLRLHVQAELGLLASILMENTRMGLGKVEAFVDDLTREYTNPFRDKLFDRLLDSANIDEPCALRAIVDEAIDCLGHNYHETYVNRVKNEIKERKKEKRPVRYAIPINPFLRSLGVRLHVVHRRATETSDSLCDTLNAYPLEYATLFAYHIFVGVLDKISNYKRKEFCRDLVETYASDEFRQDLPTDAFGLNAAFEVQQEAEVEAQAAAAAVAEGTQAQTEAKSGVAGAGAGAVDLTQEAGPAVQEIETQGQGQGQGKAPAQKPAPPSGQEEQDAQTEQEDEDDEEDEDEEDEDEEDDEEAEEAATSLLQSSKRSSIIAGKRKKPTTSTPQARLARTLGPSSQGSVAFGSGLPRRRSQRAKK